MNRTQVTILYLSFSLVMVAGCGYLFYLGIPIFKTMVRTHEMPPDSFLYMLFTWIIISGVGLVTINFLRTKALQKDPTNLSYYFKKYPQLEKGERKALFELLSDPGLPEDERQFLQAFSDMYHKLVKY